MDRRKYSAGDWENHEVTEWSDDDFSDDNEGRFFCCPRPGFGYLRELQWHPRHLLSFAREFPHYPRHGLGHHHSLFCSSHESYCYPRR